MTQRDSEILGHEFCLLLKTEAHHLDSVQRQTDECKWEIAKQANDGWEEYRPYFETKAQYYEEVSRVANLGLKQKRFSDSGETLRRWCEVQATYANFESSDALILSVSFDHLSKAKKLAAHEKVKSPIDALIEAVKNSWTADEMSEHFDPAQEPTIYDKVTGWLDGLQDRENWKWLNSADKVKRVLFHVAEIRKISEEQ